MDVEDGEELALRRYQKKDFLTLDEKCSWKKVHGQKEARLVEISQTFVDNDAPFCEDFIHYNQETADGNEVPLADGHYFILHFVGEKQIPFTILRRQNYEALKYYRQHIGDYFRIEVKKDE